MDVGSLLSVRAVTSRKLHTSGDTGIANIHLVAMQNSCLMADSVCGALLIEADGIYSKKRCVCVSRWGNEKIKFRQKQTEGSKEVKRVSL